ncbi:MAG: CBS domain-containing protein [Ignavibacteriales bacterium]
MKVREVMHRGVACAEPGTPIRDVAAMMLKADVGSIPIHEKGRLVGIVTDRDIAVRAVADGRDIDALTAREVMTFDPLCCRESDDLDRTIALMEHRKVRRVPVIGDAGEPIGMVSLGDIAGRVGKDESGELLNAVSEHHA